MGNSGRDGVSHAWTRGGHRSSTYKLVRPCKAVCESVPKATVKLGKQPLRPSRLPVCAEVFGRS